MAIKTCISLASLAMRSAAIRRFRRRSGVTLIEVLVAVSLLGVSGIAFVQLARESARAVAAVHARDDALARASQFVDAVSLWSREDLDRRLGAHVQGDWMLYLERRGTLYVVLLTDSGSTKPLIETALFRPAARTPSHAP